MRPSTRYHLRRTQMTSLTGRSWLVNHGPDMGAKLKTPLFKSFVIWFEKLTNDSYEGWKRGENGKLDCF